MSNSIQAFPLSWPAGRPRTKSRERAAFHRRESRTVTYTNGTTGTRTDSKPLTIGDSRDRVLKELSALGASGTVISSNLRLRQDGLPISGQVTPTDPGIAVYFTLNKHPHCLSCDRWDRAADNLAAIAKHVEAMRGQVRWGVADIAAMFAGFKELPAPGAITAGAFFTTADQAAEWAVGALSTAIVGASASTVLSNREIWALVYRDLVKRYHPDRTGLPEGGGWKKTQEAKALIESSRAASGL